MSKYFTQGHAVVIGAGADLPVTINDAQGLAKILLDPARCAYPPKQVKLLTDKDAQRDDIITALTRLAESTREDDTAIVYFSGHGHIEGPDFYLIPNGARRKDLANTAISADEFTQHLRAIKTQKLLVLLDCCYAGGQAEAKSFNQSPMPSEAINEIGRGSGRVVIASSRKNEKSYTSTPYSQFTKAVIEALCGAGSFERDSYARVLDLAMYVGRFVPNRTFDKQHPIIKIDNLQNNFAVAWYAAGEITPKSPPWQEGVESYLSALADNEQTASRQRMLINLRENMLLIEERMSEFVDFTAIPLQLIKNKRQTEGKINELEVLLRGGDDHAR